MDNATKYLLISVFIVSVALGACIIRPTEPTDCIIQTGSEFADQMNDTTIERNLTKEFYDFPPDQTCTRGEVCTYICGNGTIKTCNMGWKCVENV